jgi:protein-disulfide isomerase
MLLAFLLAAGAGATPPGPAGTAPDRTGPGAVAETTRFNEIGVPDAPVTIIEFSDLQCPYCARHAAQVLPELRRNYVDAGKLRYAARDLPLPRHVEAFPAAVAARCAGEQGRFWEFREALFMARARLGEDTYAALAQDFGLDAGRFEACRRDGTQAAAVRADMALASRQGIHSTPTFVIGRTAGGEFQGEVVVGAKPYEEFAERIDELLRAAR